MMVWLLAPPTLVALSKYFVLAIVPTMAGRLVLNLRGSRREDVMPTSPSTTDNAGAGAYEMQAKGFYSSSNGRVVFVSRQDGMSAQDRAQLNQMRSASDYQRLGGKERKQSWNAV
ncbi:hypothetical protein FRC12_022550 [Ceratobasidium sp. 428]|nr:hypothetical protein FRC12_022550 [Ceratobasidium sp. 428]